MEANVEKFNADVQLLGLSASKNNKQAIKIELNTSANRLKDMINVDLRNDIYVLLTLVYSHICRI